MALSEALGGQVLMPGVVAEPPELLVLLDHLLDTILAGENPVPVHGVAHEPAPRDDAPYDRLHRRVVQRVPVVDKKIREEEGEEGESLPIPAASKLVDDDTSGLTSIYSFFFLPYLPRTPKLHTLTTTAREEARQASRHIGKTKEYTLEYAS
mgnify:CR=1 FL=1